jgi:hypothetical protein
LFERAKTINGVTMLRRSRQAIYLGTLLSTSVAVAQTGGDPLAEDKPATAAPAAEAAPAAAPAATPTEESEPEVAATTRTPKRSVASAGMDTQAVTMGGGGTAGEGSSADEWAFKFKGFFRGPMRIGLDNSGKLTPGKLQFHTPPVVPDGNYTRWMYTNVSPGPWAELLFQYGTQRVMMTTSIASYNITSGGWRELQDQLGIDRAFLTLKFPEALGDLGGMAVDVGVFSNRYGGMGRYDAGQYETYIIGRTRNAGFTGTFDLAVSDNATAVIEGGFGAKIDQQYQRYAGSNAPTYDYPSWQPYPGDNVQQGSSLLAHLHAGLVIDGNMTLMAHYLNTFTRDARWNVGSTGGTATKPSDANAPGKGSIQVMGADFKLDGSSYGDAYLGVSYLMASNAGALSDTLEVLHSQGGSQLAKNYFAAGTGNVLTIAGQYTFSLAAFMMRPKPFWGQTADITIRPFFMFNKVSGAGAGENVSKLKGGVEGTYSFLPNMAAALRIDTVQPNMDNKNQSFTILSPKLIFRTDFVTHEMIILQYSGYLLGSEYTDPATSDRVMPWPYGQYGTWSISKLNGSPPDKHVLTLSACMWW